MLKRWENKQALRVKMNHRVANRDFLLGERGWCLANVSPAKPQGQFVATGTGIEQIAPEEKHRNLDEFTCNAATTAYHLYSSPHISVDFRQINKLVNSALRAGLKPTQASSVKSLALGFEFAAWTKPGPDCHGEFAHAVCVDACPNMDHRNTRAFVEI